MEIAGLTQDALIILRVFMTWGVNVSHNWSGKLLSGMTRAVQ